jgi:RHS repeat-associated protein
VVYHVRTDHIGRPVFATDSSGLKVWEASYLPFGGVHVATSFPGTSTDPLELRFPGQWFQAESGLHQNWMRDYDPTTGRYIQADPLGLVDGASVYGYALQSPMRYVDPKGLCAGPLAIVCAGAVLGSSTTSTATVGAGAGTAIALALTVSPTAIGDGTLTLSQTYGQTCSIETRAQLIPSSSLPQISYAKGVPSPPFDYPSDWDGISPPAPGWTWQGAPGSRPGDRRGNWVSPDGGTSISPDFEHEEPIGPHIDITGKGKKPSRWFPNGTIEPKR